MFAVFLAAAPASAQLIIGGGPGSGPIWNVNPASPASPAPLPGSAGSTPWGMTYDPATNSLFWITTGDASYFVSKSPYSAAGLAPSLVGGGILPGGGSFVGMAFDSSANRLYAALWSGPDQTSIYEINRANGAATFAATLPAGRYFTGFEYDAGGDRFLGTSGLASGPPGGLFEISFRTGTPSYTQIGLYPVVETQVEALAVGNGRAYLVNSDGPIFVFNLSTGLYDPHLVSPLSGSGFGVAGAAWVPAPASILGLMALSLSRRRRR